MMKSVPACHTPLPASPVKGEVSYRIWGAILPNSPARHLPLDGGGWVGVLHARETLGGTLP